MKICKRLRGPCFAGAAVVFALGASIASADVVTSDLTVTNATSAIGTASSYGTVTVSLTGHTATITFTAASGYGFVGNRTADIYTVSGATCSPITTSLTCTGFNNAVDGLGSFNQTTDSGNASTPLSTVQFTLTSSSYTSASDVLVANTDGYDAAAHVAFASACASGLTCTGFVGERAGAVVPEPSAIVLLGSCIIVLGALVRRRRSRSKAKLII